MAKSEPTDERLARDGRAALMACSPVAVTLEFAEKSRLRREGSEPELRALAITCVRQHPMAREGAGGKIWPGSACGGTQLL